MQTPDCLWSTGLSYFVYPGAASSTAKIVLHVTVRELFGVAAITIVESGWQNLVEGQSRRFRGFVNLEYGDRGITCGGSSGAAERIVNVRRWRR